MSSLKEGARKAAEEISTKANTCKKTYVENYGMIDVPLLHTRNIGDIEAIILTHLAPILEAKDAEIHQLEEYVAYLIGLIPQDVEILTIGGWKNKEEE